jgi:DHA3 family macrolide efflux protein-like MFS transporter
MAVSGVWFLCLAAVPASMFFLAVAVLFGVGVSSTITNASYSAALRASLPPELLGRIATLIRTAEDGLKPPALLIAGFLADRAGADVWYAIDGAAAIAIGVTALFVPAILRLEQDGAEIMRRRSLIAESAGRPDA